jgi:hypothetical protein
MLRFLIAALALAIPSSASADELSELYDLRAQLEGDFPNWKVVAVCGASSGKSYFMQELQKGWQDDQISSGNLIFLIDDQGNPDVLFIDATQDVRSSALEGAKVVELFSRPDSSEHVWLVAYASTGTTETYSLSLGGPIKLVMWSQGRPSVQVGTEPNRTIGAKMAAFVARCV